MATDKSMNQHKRMAMGDKVTGMKKGGMAKKCDSDNDGMKKGGMKKGSKKK